jgi:hypothetical protein
MHFIAKSRSLIALAILAAAPAAFASDVDSVTATPNGGNTTFAVTGTYLPGTNVSAISSPGGSYLLTFTLPTTPDPASFDFTLPFGIFAITTDVTVNDVHFHNSEVLFFDASLGGGTNICLNSGCVDTNPVCGPTGCIDSNPPSPTSWAIYGDQLFSGTQDNPTFLSGSFFVAQPDSYVTIAATPEPSSMVLLGTGLLGCAASFTRKLRRRAVLTSR